MDSVGLFSLKQNLPAGVLALVLLAGSYGVWAVTRQVRRIARVMEDVAHMHVESRLWLIGEEGKVPFFLCHLLRNFS